MTDLKRFRNRREAGQLLGQALGSYARRKDVAVLGIARGGVPVAYEVALALRAPLDVMVVRKLGLPEQPELAIGAIAPSGIRVLNDRVISELSIPLWVIKEVTGAERRELERRESLYRQGHQPLALADRIVILIDDGLATGATMRAAIAAVRRSRAAAVVVAVPVAQSGVAAGIRQIADDFVCPRPVKELYAVGLWYVDFSPTTDEDVRQLLDGAARRAPEAA